MTYPIGNRTDIIDALTNGCGVSYEDAVDFVQTYLAGAIQRYEDYTRPESNQKFFFFTGGSHDAIQRYFSDCGFIWSEIRDEMNFIPHYNLSKIENTISGHSALLGWLLEITK